MFLMPFNFDISLGRVSGLKFSLVLFLGRSRNLQKTADLQILATVIQNILSQDYPKFLDDGTSILVPGFENATFSSFTIEVSHKYVFNAFQF